MVAVETRRRPGEEWDDDFCDEAVESGVKWGERVRIEMMCQMHENGQEMTRKER